MDTITNFEFEEILIERYPFIYYSFYDIRAIIMRKYHLIVYNYKLIDFVSSESNEVLIVSRNVSYI